MSVCFANYFSRFWGYKEKYDEQNSHLHGTQGMDVTATHSEGKAFLPPQALRNAHSLPLLLWSLRYHLFSGSMGSEDRN